MLPIIYSAGAVSNKVADVEQEACPWRYLLIDVMCVFMEARSRCFISGYKETLEGADSKCSSERTFRKVIFKNHYQKNLYTSQEVTTLFNVKKRRRRFQNKWAASKGRREGAIFPFWSLMWSPQAKNLTNRHTCGHTQMIFMSPPSGNKRGNEKEENRYTTDKRKDTEINKLRETHTGTSILFLQTHHPGQSALCGK